MHQLNILGGRGRGTSIAKLSCLKYMIKFGYTETLINLFNYTYNFGIKGNLLKYIAVLEIFNLIHRSICSCINNRCCLNAPNCYCKAVTNMGEVSERSV